MASGDPIPDLLDELASLGEVWAKHRARGAREPRHVRSAIIETAREIASAADFLGFNPLPTISHCACGKKLASECLSDDQWGPGCDLGNNAAHAKTAPPAFSQSPAEQAGEAPDPIRAALELLGQGKAGSDFGVAAQCVREDCVSVLFALNGPVPQELRLSAKAVRALIGQLARAVLEAEGQQP